MPPNARPASASAVFVGDGDDYDAKTARVAAQPKTLTERERADSVTAARGPSLLYRSKHGAQSSSHLYKDVRNYSTTDGKPLRGVNRQIIMMDDGKTKVPWGALLVSSQDGNTRSPTRERPASARARSTYSNNAAINAMTSTPPLFPRPIVPAYGLPNPMRGPSLLYRGVHGADSSSHGKKDLRRGVAGGRDGDEMRGHNHSRCRQIFVMDTGVTQVCYLG